MRTGKAILRPFAAEDAKRVNEDGDRPGDERDGVIGSHFAMVVDILSRLTPTGPTILPIRKSKSQMLMG